MIKSDINQGFSDKKPEIFNEKPEIPNISNEISKQKPGIYKEKPEFYEEKFETVKKSNGINQETVKKNAYYEGKTNFESAFSEEMNKMKKSLEILNKESEDLKEEFKNKGFTKEKIEISTLKDEFFKEKTEFLDYLKTIKGKKPGIESFEGKSLSFEIKMRENQKENDNFIENLMVVMPKQAKLLINIENRLFIMEIKGQDIENEYLSAVLCDLMGN